MLRFCFLVALALCAGSFAAPAAPVPVHLMPKEEPLLFPTTVGAKTVLDWDGIELAQVVSKVEKGKDGVTVELELDGPAGKRTHSQTVTVSPRGVLRTHQSGKELAEPLWVVVLPHSEKNKWEHKTNGVTYTSRTAGWDELDTKSGKVRALRVDRYQTGSDEITASYWYAPGMGRVQTHFPTTVPEVWHKLKSFTPGK